MLSENSKTSCMYNIIPIFIKIIYIRLYMHRKKKDTIFQQWLSLDDELMGNSFKKSTVSYKYFTMSMYCTYYQTKSYFFPPVKDIQQMDGGDHNPGWI